jgi:hypothetical protein
MATKPDPEYRPAPAPGSDATVEEAAVNLREPVELFLESASLEGIKQRLHTEVFVTRFDAAHG